VHIGVDDGDRDFVLVAACRFDPLDRGHKTTSFSP
jgi:hypothetical protein